MPQNDIHDMTGALTSSQICLLRAIHALHLPRRRGDVAFDDVIELTRFQRARTLFDLGKLDEHDFGVAEHQLPTETLVPIDPGFMQPLTLQRLAARERTRHEAPDLDPRPLAGKIDPEHRGRTDLPLTPAAYLLLAVLAQEKRPVTLDAITGRLAYPPGGGDMAEALGELQQKGWRVIAAPEGTLRVSIPSAPRPNTARRRMLAAMTIGFAATAALAGLLMA